MRETAVAQANRRCNGRWTALHTEDGRRKSAGTYDSEKEALHVAREQETFLLKREREAALYSALSPAERARLTIAEYWRPWLKSHPVEPSTKKTYRARVVAHILPAFGQVAVRELTREQIRE